MDDTFIRFANVDFHYGAAGSAATPILSGLDLTIRRGEFYVLLGPSGCGKTTALNLLAGFEQLSGGQLTVGGAPVVMPGMDRVMIFQGDDSLYGWLTAIENIEFPLRMTGISKAERRIRANVWLERVGLGRHAAKFPHELSGGMKQRIQIARALICDSQVLLMDEPFGALDAQTRSILQDELATLSKHNGATVLFITHDIAEAIILADRIGIMRAGPGSAVKEEITVETARPRHRGSTDFATLYDRIERSLSKEVQKVVQQEALA
ncbi:ABC transporter ATP-binding protein [Belnapia rosea]|uniref:ABC transporter ATP-binding protein n=1 Tax=Belnapia rosea TaxID=938405 RepID=UPI000884565C|nr:ABC transporter ATP-binding protein [Belnapia rosea]SDB74398.1 NitT/TauT family transport system ATP-binding protein [Belnapia rosea]